MSRRIIVCAALALLSTAAWAGVVVEMEVKDPSAPGKTSSETLYGQGEMTRVDSPAGAGDNSSVIFRDESMVFVDHDKKTCQKISKQDMEQLMGQVSAVMKQMENLPPEQRAMMEKMMKGKMPGLKEPPTHRVEKGGSDKVGEYPCTIHTLYSDERKVSEVCLADESVSAAFAEAMGGFRALSKFAEELMEVAQNMPFGNMIKVPFEEMREMDGFPVRTRMFDRAGNVTQERTLKSITRREIEAQVFEIPEGYKVKNLGDELQKNKRR